VKLYPNEDEARRRAAALRRKQMRTVQDVDAILASVNLERAIQRRKKQGLGIHMVRPAAKPARDW